MGLGGFRGISASYSKIPPNPPLRKGGTAGIVVSISYENFGLSSQLPNPLATGYGERKVDTKRKIEDLN
jgi:hypothetical protein